MKCKNIAKRNKHQKLPMIIVNRKDLHLSHVTKGNALFSSNKQIKTTKDLILNAFFSSSKQIKTTKDFILNRMLSVTLKTMEARSSASNKPVWLLMILLFIKVWQLHAILTYQMHTIIILTQSMMQIRKQCFSD